MYELWDLISYTEGEDLYPFSKICEYQNFYEVYVKFQQESKKRPVVIFFNSQTKEKK